MDANPSCLGGGTPCSRRHGRTSPDRHASVLLGSLLLLDSIITDSPPSTVSFSVGPRTFAPRGARSPRFLTDRWAATRVGPRNQRDGCAYGSGTARSWRGEMTRLSSASLRRVSAVTKHEGDPCCPALWPQNLLLLPRLLSPSLLAASPTSREKPRAKPPAAPTTHHLEPWARQPRPHRVRVPAHHAAEDSPSEAARDRRRSSSDASRKAAVDHEGGIDGLRAKLVGHLRDAADRLRVPKPSPPLPPPPKETEPEPETMAPPAAQEQQQQQQAKDVEDKPWKLRERTRRRPAALTSWPAAPSPSRRRKRAPFSVSLSQEEIEEDIYSLTGGRPRRRPRKRPRAVQRQLDSAFPGLWLTEITADDYKVPDPDEE